MFATWSRQKSLLPLLCLLLLLLPPAAVQAADSSPLRICAILALSGEGASWGEAAKNGMAIAWDKIPDEVRSKLQIVYEDDALNPKGAVTAFNKLVNSGGCGAVISLASPSGSALAPLTEAKHIPMLAIATDPKISIGRTYAFNFWVTPETEIALMQQEMQSRGYRAIARTATESAGAQAVNRIFDDLNKGRFQLLLDESFAPDIKDFRTYLARLKKIENQIDGVMITLFPGQLAVFAKQQRGFGIKKPLFAFETVEDVNEVRLAEGALDGTWYVNAGGEDPGYLAEYQKRFPGASSYGSANSHDALLLIAAAVKQGVPAAELHNYLRTLKDFKGALGTYSATGDQRFTLPAAIKVIEPGGFRVLH
jgi:branched-chain amino acid transport system substrate-binding protein